MLGLLKMNGARRMARAIVAAAFLMACALVCSLVTATPADAKVGCRVEIDRSILPAGGPQKAVVKVTLLPEVKETGSRRRPPVNLALVLDKSGSMTGEKIEKAKEAAIEALRRLGPRDRFSVVVYSHTASTIVPAQSAKNTEWIEDRIRSIRADGSTALFAGVSLGAAEVRKNLDDRYVHRIILLSDGLANVGPSAPEDLGRLGAALLKEGVSVSTVGVGTDYNEDLMARLAQKSDGNTYFVESGRDVPRIFSAELGDVLHVAAKKVKVIIEFSSGVNPVGIIGREGRIRGRSVEILLNQLYHGQEKYVLVDTEVPVSKDGAEMDIASAQVSFEDPVNRNQKTSSGRVSARFSADAAAVSNSANQAVQRDYALNLNALAQERAIVLSDRGKTQEAVQQLKTSVRNLQEAGQKYQDPDLLDKAKQVEQQAAQIDREGMSQRDRKTLRTDSYQLKNQQRR